MAEVIVAHTGWAKGGKIDLPIRFVVVKNDKKDPRFGQYEMFTEVKKSSGETYYIFGHYDMHKEDALEFLKKYHAKNNREFGVGNPSHVPGPITLVK
jgi:hypothetical protein